MHALYANMQYLRCFVQLNIFYRMFMSGPKPFVARLTFSKSNAVFILTVSFFFFILSKIMRS